MDIVNFTENIILSIVEDKEIAKVKEFPSEKENEILIEVIVSDKDMPRLIGKNGKVINSVRIVVQAYSYLKDNKLVKINVDSI